jgi:hypothetical protein
MTLLGKVLPTQLAGTPEQPIVLSVEQHRGTRCADYPRGIRAAAGG